MIRAAMKQGLRWMGAALALTLVVAATAAEADAQSVGIEAGVASVESFDGVRPEIGVSLFLPLTERLRIAGTASQWTGCPDDDCDEPREGFGNRGFNVLGLFTALDGRRTDLSLGAGMGWYEMKRPTSSGTDSESFYDEALTFAIEVRREVAFNSAMYLRGQTSFPTDDSEPRWTSLRLGVDVRPF